MKMNILFVFLLVSLTSFAQDKIGVELGVGLSNLRDDSFPENRDGLISIYPSLFYERDITSNFSLKGLMSYERKGFSFDFNPIVFDQNDNDLFFTSSNLSQTIQSEYFTVGVLGKYTFGGGMPIFVNAGPYLGFDLETEGSSNSSDYGIFSGIGLEKEINSLTVFLEIRNSFGLANTVRNAPLSEFQNVKTIAFYLLSGISYNL